MQMPRIEQLPRSDRYWLVQRYQAYAQGMRITIKPGFEYDGASIPRFLLDRIGGPFAGRYAPAALVHDALYEGHLVERELADRVFYDLMRQNGVRRVKAWIMHKGVRMGGWKGWNRYTQEHIAATRELVSIEHLEEVER